MKRTFEESDIREGLAGYIRSYVAKPVDSPYELLMIEVRKARERRLRAVVDEKERAAWELVKSLQGYKNERQRAAYMKANRALNRVWGEQERLGAEFAELYGLKSGTGDGASSP